MKNRKNIRGSIFILLVIATLLISTIPMPSANNKYEINNQSLNLNPSKPSYVTKEKDKPNYNTGIPKSYSDSVIDNWDWRNRHDATDPNSPYYDNDPLGTGWITPAKNQNDPFPCGSCMAFAAAGQTEAMINLYFNKHLDYDLSEQQLYSCWDESYSQFSIYEIIRDFGAINESVFPYVAEQVECMYKWDSESDTLVRINESSNLYIDTDNGDRDIELLKRNLIEHGPLFSAWHAEDWGSAHAILIVGYGTIEAGDNILEKPYENKIVLPDSPLIGEPYWIIKNSYGPEHQDNGFFNLSLNQSHLYGIRSIETPLSITVDGESIQEVEWYDKDGDGYYNWGIGPKPEECPDDVPDEEDGNDNNVHLGPLNDSYYFTIIGENILVKKDNYPILSRGSYDLGFTCYQESITTTFTIENPGVQPLHLTGNPIVVLVGDDETDFSIIKQPESNCLYPGETATFTIKFTPSTGGLKKVKVMIKNDDPYANEYVFTLSGKQYEVFNRDLATWYKTIQEGINNANSGDLLLVPEGEYYSENEIVINKGITLQSLRGASVTTINGKDSHRCFVLNHKNAILRGFTITKGYNDKYQGYGGGVKNNAGTLENCILTNNFADMGGGIAAISADSYIKKCVIIDNDAILGGGIYAFKGATIENCLIKANHATSLGGGICLGICINDNVNTVDLCTVVENNAGTSGGGIYSFGNKNSVTNSIVYFNEVEGSNEQDNYNAQVNFGYSCTTPLPEQGKGNIDDDPVFINTGSRPYSLYKSSPCINAGDPDDLILPLLDLAGKTRLVAGRVDMGAYEFQKNGYNWPSVSNEETSPGIE